MSALSCLWVVGTDSRIDLEVLYFVEIGRIGRVVVVGTKVESLVLIDGSESLSFQIAERFDGWVFEKNDGNSELNSLRAVRGEHYGYWVFHLVDCQTVHNRPGVHRQFQRATVPRKPDVLAGLDDIPQQK